MDLKGVYAPIPTPFDPEGKIDWKSLRTNIGKWLNSPLDGFVVGGSNGEFPSLSFEERVDLTASVVRETSGRIPVITGIHCPSLAETIELGREAARAGSDAVLVLPPHYYKGQNTAESLRTYFTKIADSSPVPVVLYNMPSNTGVNMDPATVRSISEHPRIIGIKDSSGDIVQITKLCMEARPGFSVFAGSGGFFLAGLSVGCTGGTLAVANVLPCACNSLMTAVSQGNLKSARELQQGILNLNYAVTKGYGIAGLKTALDIIGLYGGECREPLLPLKAASRETLSRLLEECGLLDKEGWL